MKPKNKRLSEYLRSARLTTGLSQAELASKMGLSPGRIGHFETGHGQPSPDQLAKLEQILGLKDDKDDVDAERPTPITAWLQRALGQKGWTQGELAAKADLSVATIYNILSGRAQNPHPKTISAIEKALAIEFESKEELPPGPPSTGIGALIDFDPYSNQELPRKAGVYVLYDISQRPVYVGKAKQIADRIKSHHDKFWFKRPIVEIGAYVEVGDNLLRDQIETVLIQFLKNNAVINKQKTVREED